MFKAHRLLNDTSTGRLVGLIAAVIVLLCGIVLTLVFHIDIKHALGVQSRQHQIDSVQQLSIAAIPFILNNDRISLNLLVEEWPKPNDLKAIRVINNQQQLIAEFGEVTKHNEIYAHQITQDGRKFGEISAHITTESAVIAAKQSLAVGLMLTAIASFISALLCYLAAERQGSYFRQLRQRLINWQSGEDLILPDIALATAEQKLLHDTMGQIAQLESRKRAMERALGQFMSTDEPNANVMRYYNCALLYIEIQDLHVLQTRLSAEQLTDTLNHYHRLFSQAAKLYNGRVDRYLGDGIVMMFGLQSNDDKSNMHCLHAAKLLAGLVQNTVENEKDITPVEFNIAAHSGSVLIAPMQNDQQSQCNLIGDTVHWASQLAQHGEVRRILVSQELVDSIEESACVQWSEGPLIIDLHGRQQNAYWLSSLAPKTESLIDRQIKHISSMTESA